MIVNNKKKEDYFFELFNTKQKAYEELKNYVLSKRPLIGEKKLKDLLEKKCVQ